MSEPAAPSATVGGDSKLAASLTILGTSGLQTYGGRVYSEQLTRLRGRQGRKLLREFATNEPTAWTVIRLVRMMLRSVPWRVEPFSEDPGHQEHADFIRSLPEDMSHTWAAFVSEVFTLLEQGFSICEIVFKVRKGPRQEDPSYRSRHADNRIGWRQFMFMDPLTIDRWEFADDGSLVGAWQWDLESDLGQRKGQRFIPFEKMLLFRTEHRSGNPEPPSALRGAVIPYLRKKGIEDSEAIGFERELGGLPVMRLPPDWFSETATPAQLAAKDSYLDTMRRMRLDEQAGIALPAAYNDQGKALFDLTLLSSAGKKAMDPSATINRYRQEIAQTLFADFILLGHMKVGTSTLSEDKTDIFTVAIDAWLQDAAEVINRHLIPLTYELNGWDSSECAYLVPERPRREEVAQWATAVSQVVQAGLLIPGAMGDEAHVRRKLGFPEGDLGAETETAAKPKADEAEAPAPVVAAGPASADVQQTALNGAQVQALMGVVTAAAQGQLPRDSAVEIIVASFPVNRETASRILGSVGQGFVPAAPEPGASP